MRVDLSRWADGTPGVRLSANWMKGGTLWRGNSREAFRLGMRLICQAVRCWIRERSR